VVGRGRNARVRRSPPAGCGPRARRPTRATVARATAGLGP